ncbi:MAG: class I SAM-dependent methyltransferase [Chloracidobacterium sp.]|nr:class I SAM-dependent methyltransferase [Chloracidobacterium sp.]
MNPQYESLTKQYATKPEDYYEFDRSEMLAYVPAESSLVLDVGCSSGAFGNLIKQRSPSSVVWGIEPDKNSSDLASTRLDRVINKEFAANMPELEGVLFDIICFNDVLEHMVNPDLALEFCKSYLTAQGMIVASIPNILYYRQIAKILIRQDWKYEDEGVLDNTHLRLFTKKSIIRMFETCGYRVLKIEGLSSGFSLKYSILNALTLGHFKDWRHMQFAVQPGIDRDVVESN